MQIITIPAVLNQSSMISPKVKHFVFSLEQGVFHYLPGQFITIHFEYQGKNLKRSYSIANSPNENNIIEFAAGYVADGPGTDYLFNLKVGDTININGPFGRLVLKDDMPKRYILAATSTGVTPYRSMLKELTIRLQANPNLNVLLMLGVQTPADILYREDFEAFAHAYPKQVSFRVQLSQAKGLALKSNQYNGYIQHAFADIALNVTEDVIYLCGNPQMIDEAFEELKGYGFVTQQIIREKYLSR